MGRDEAGATTEYEGLRYYFCWRFCRDEFEATRRGSRSRPGRRPRSETKEEARRMSNQAWAPGVGSSRAPRPGGAEHGRKFAAHGARVALIARGLDGLRAARIEVEALGGEALCLPVDVANAEEVSQAAHLVAETWGESTSGSTAR